MAFQIDTIRSAAQRAAASHGLDVVDVEYQGDPKHRTLRIFIEKNAETRARLIAEAQPPESELALPAGLNAAQVAGVTHDDCTAFSRDFGTLLDVEELVPGDEYTLEVSSPGLDRKLYGLADYQRFTGNLVKLQTFTAVAGNRHWQGRLTLVSDQAVALDLAALKQKGKARKASQKTNQDTVEIAISNIEKANLIPEF